MTSARPPPPHRVSARNGSLARLKDGSPRGGVQIAHETGLIGSLAWHPFFTAGSLAILLLGLVSFFLADGEPGLFNRTQRVISQSAGAASISLARGSRKQVGINWLLQLTAAFPAFAGTIACLYVIAGIAWE